MVLNLFSILEDPEYTKDENIITALMVFYEDVNTVEDVYSLPDVEEAIMKMFEFCNGGRPDTTNKPEQKKLMDWDADAAIIMSAINNVAGKEVRAEEYVHWWTFLGWYMAIGECTFSTVVSIREKIRKGKKKEKWEQEFIFNNPEYFSVDLRSREEKEMDEWLKSVWNKE